MKRIIFPLICLLAVMSTTTAYAQSNICSAFDAIIKCSHASITEKHSFTKYPDTMKKSGQLDQYDFELPLNKFNLIEKVLEAFDKDKNKAYQYTTGKIGKKNDNIRFAIGDGSSNVDLTEPGDDYATALFLAPRKEDPSGNYRYAYGIAYSKTRDKWVGRLVVTYATTLKYRQGYHSRSTTIITDSNGKKSWFETFMSCIDPMTTATPKTRINLATKVYNLVNNINQYPEVTENDKNTVREILKVMISQPKYSDPVLNSLLQQSLNCLR